MEALVLLLILFAASLLNLASARPIISQPFDSPGNQPTTPGEPEPGQPIGEPRLPFKAPNGGNVYSSISFLAVF
jgi:hypothetical protein